MIYIRPAGGATFHYHRDEAKTAQAWRDGAFTVGDIGRLDGDGYLYITDRVSDMVIRDGVNVYPRRSRTSSTSTPRSSTARCSASRTNATAR